MALLTDLLHLMSVLSIVFAVALGEDSKTVHNIWTHDAKQNKLYHQTSGYQNCTNPCNFTNQQIECIDCLPQIVNSSIKQVVLSRFNQSRFDPKMFCGVSWPKVDKLTIFSNGVDRFIYLKNYTFDCLPKIKVLKLGLRNLKHLDKHALYGLDSIHTLDLTGCNRLEIPGLAPGLEFATTAPRLKTLILSNVGTAYDGIQLSQNFVSILAYRNISSLDISSTTVGFANTNVNIDKLCKALERINVANSILTYLKFTYPSTCDSLRVLDFSGVTFPQSPVFIGNITVPPGCCPPIQHHWFNTFRSVTKLCMNELISMDQYVHLHNVTIRIMFDNNSIEELHFSGYNIPVFEVTLILEPNHVKYLDLSNNKIEILGPNLLADLKDLKIINLSNNKLADSEHINRTFSKVFRHNLKLESARLQHNELTYLPSKVFELNTELKRIDLSNNRFTQIPFEISHLHMLQSLDFSDNLVEYLNNWSRIQIDMLYRNKQEGLNTTDDEPFTVDLRDNIFSCKCHSIDFIKWFIQSPVFKGSRGIYYCISDKKHISMDNGAIEAAQYDCDKPKRKLGRMLLIVLLPCVSAGIIVTLAIVAFKRYKRHTLYRRLREHIGLIHENQLQHRFPVFLSYASDDSEFVEANVLRPLQP